VKLKHQFRIWVPFALSSALTLLVYATLWHANWYWSLLSLLGALSVVCGLRALQQTDWSLPAIAGVVTALLFGQWWLVEMLLSQLAWRATGLAP
jgi:hypothetical protein